MNEKKNQHRNYSRNRTTDVIRGFAIITVIIGHCIQQGNGLAYFENSLYWSNKLYQFIYSFHMPLFMLLAGWYAYQSLKRVEDDRSKQWRLLGTRIVQYIVPIFFWTLFEYVRGYIINTRLGNPTTGFPQIIVLFGKTFITNLWFLWAVFVCLIIVFVMHFYLKDNLCLYILGFCMLFVLPDGYNLGVYKYMMPYYIGAFYINMNREKFRESKPGKKICALYKKSDNLCICIMGVVFCALFMLYRERAFIYLSGYKLTKAAWASQLVVDIYRMVIGFAGSAFFILVFDKLVRKFSNYSWPVLSAFGRNSLGIYILQGYYILMIMVIYTNDLPPVWWHIIIEAVLISTASLLTSVALGSIPVIRCLVGQKPTRRKR